MLSLNKSIRHFIAGLLLAVFAFGITPKQVWHDWLAHHKEAVGHCYYANITHYGAEGFRCNCDNLVAESPFTHDLAFYSFTTLPVCASRQAFVLPHVYAPAPFLTPLRGPPAAAI